MRRPVPSVVALLALLASLAVPAARAGAADARGVEFAPPAPLEMAWPLMNDRRVRFVRYNGPWAHVTYGRILGPDGERAEIVYAVAADDDHVVDIPFDLRRSLGEWMWLKGQVRNLGPSEDAHIARWKPRYRRFRHAASDQNCFAFMAAWQVRGLDQQARAAKSAFGYYCAPKGRALPTDPIDWLLAGLTFKDATNVDRRPLAGNDPAALAFARAGAPRFPFDFGHTLREGGRDRRDP